MRRLVRSWIGLSVPRESERSERGAGRAADSLIVTGLGARSLPAKAHAPRRIRIAKTRRRNRGMYAFCPGRGLGDPAIGSRGLSGSTRSAGVQPATLD